MVAVVMRPPRPGAKGTLRPETARRPRPYKVQLTRDALGCDRKRTHGAEQSTGRRAARAARRPGPLLWGVAAPAVSAVYCSDVGCSASRADVANTWPTGQTPQVIVSSTIRRAVPDTGLRAPSTGACRAWPWSSPVCGASHWPRPPRSSLSPEPLGEFRLLSRGSPPGADLAGNRASFRLGPTGRNSVVHHRALIWPATARHSVSGRPAGTRVARVGRAGPPARRPKPTRVSTPVTGTLWRSA
jgi:hypothetical protein